MAAGPVPLPVPAGDDPELVEWRGERFRVHPDGVALAPLIRLAQAAKRGVDANEMDGLAALGDALEAALAPGEYDRLMDHATREHADGDALMGALERVLTAAADRPTRRPSGSSGGPPPTGEGSTGDSSSRVLARLEGRPDLQLAVLRAQEDQRRAAS